jgi:hypothetical protein
VRSALVRRQFKGNIEDGRFALVRFVHENISYAYQNKRDSRAKRAMRILNGDLQLEADSIEPVPVDKQNPTALHLGPKERKRIALGPDCTGPIAADHGRG